MSGHTPGPWHPVYTVPHIPTPVRAQDESPVAEVWDDGESAANAHLVAAAPDLLEAVETSLCPGQMDPNRTAKDCYEAGTCGCNNGTAIAKARGHEDTTP